MIIDIGDLSNPAAFVIANTRPSRPPLLPEIELLLASELVPLWQATEADLAASGLPPPYWAFAWSGGQALARYILDTPETVAGKTVLDFGSGSGLVAIAAKLAGATHVLAADIDAYAVEASRLNARHNGVSIHVTGDDLIGTFDRHWQVVLAGDICYEQPMAQRAEGWLRSLAGHPQTPATVLIGDPGRNHLPQQSMHRLARYAVKTTTELEDSDLRNAIVWQLLA
jgi:predicted nicotinamide N-methyase